jgi:hypothetical protein
MVDSYEEPDIRIGNQGPHGNGHCSWFDWTILATLAINSMQFTIKLKLINVSIDRFNMTSTWYWSLEVNVLLAKWIDTYCDLPRVLRVL